MFYYLKSLIKLMLAWLRHSHPYFVAFHLFRVHFTVKSKHVTMCKSLIMHNEFLLLCPQHTKILFIFKKKQVDQSSTRIILRVSIPQSTQSHQAIVSCFMFYLSFSYYITAQTKLRSSDMPQYNILIQKPMMYFWVQCMLPYPQKDAGFDAQNIHVGLKHGSPQALLESTPPSFQPWISTLSIVNLCDKNISLHWNISIFPWIGKQL